MAKFWIILPLFLCSCVAAPKQAEPSPYVHVKRASLWVPDLDRAIVFYRDVLGFQVYSEGELELKEGSVLLDLFNIDSSSRVRRALFSSSTDPRALFVMESKDAPAYGPDNRRSSVQVIQVDNIEAVKARAGARGFKVGNFNTDTIATGEKLLEMTLIGPGGQASLVYQLETPDGS